MIQQLRKRFIRIAMLSVTMVLLLLTLIVNAANFWSTNRDLDRVLQMISQNQGNIPAHGGPFSGDGPEQENPQAPEPAKERPDGPFNQETPYSTRYFYLCFEADGQLYQSDFSHIVSVTEDQAEVYVATAQKHGEGYGYYGGYKYYVRQQEDGSYTAVFLDCYQAMRGVKTVVLWSLAADLLCIALVYLLVRLFSRRAIDPVVRSARQQKQFITDASHELKTPLTVMGTCLKLLEMEGGDKKWIQKAQSQTEKMTGLVNSLVTLSRMDEEEPPIQREDFDLSRAVEETAESFRDSARDAGHALRLEIAPALRYCGDEAAIRQLVSILMENGLKYALPDGAIWLSLSRERRGIVLRSGNPCQPLEPGETEKLFDRFYRPDKSRSSATGGFGVGLSIARGIAQAHGGEISAHCPAAGEIEFTVLLR